MNVKKISLAAASVAAVAALAVGGSAIANAADNPAPTTSTTQGSADTAPQGQQGQQGRGQGKGQRAQGATGQQASPDTPAVTAKDSAVTVTEVRKDPDGSYDALGTKAGAPVFFDVSADLATITENAGGPGGGKGGPGGHAHTAVTGDEAAKVTAAVTAKDSAVTVTEVRKDPDGTYDVLGTKAGAPVMFDVSADLATVTEAAGKGGPAGGRHGAPGATDPAQQSAPSATASS